MSCATAVANKEFSNFIISGWTGQPKISNEIGDWKRIGEKSLPRRFFMVDENVFKYEKEVSNLIWKVDQNSKEIFVSDGEKVLSEVSWMQLENSRRRISSSSNGFFWLYTTEGGSQDLQGLPQRFLISRLRGSSVQCSELQFPFTAEVTFLCRH